MAKMASELEFYVFDEAFRPARDKGYRELQHRRLVHRGLPHLPDHQARAADARDPQRHGRRRHPGRRTARASGARARRSSTSSTPRRWRWPTGTRSTRTASRRSPTCRARRVTFMAKWRKDLAGSSCHIHSSLWARRTTRRPSSTRPARDGVTAVPPLPRRPAGARRRADAASWRPTSTPTSASRRARSRRPTSSGAPTTAPPASACSVTASASASNAGSPART